MRTAVVTIATAVRGFNLLNTVDCGAIKILVRIGGES
jgi:hypothetical protein